MYCTSTVRVLTRSASPVVSCSHAILFLSSPLLPSPFLFLSHCVCVCAARCRHNGSNKLIKIYSRENSFWFNDALQFRSVPELVHYFTTHSLTEYSGALDAKLLFPVSKQMLCAALVRHVPFASLFFLLFPFLSFPF